MRRPDLFTCLFSGLFFLMALVSCKDIIEPNISKSVVQPEAPGSKYQTSLYHINFAWDEVADALTYRLQVASPRFDSLGYFALDTVIRTSKFSVTLAPGSYEWRVRAQNGSYQTAYTTPRGFTIFQSSVKNQKVQLIGPANNKMVVQSAVTFSWSDLYGATKYHLEIDTNNFVNEASLVYDGTTPALQLDFNFPKDQAYQWRVRAENDTAQAQWSVINTIIYDHTPPAKVTLVAPANDQQVHLPVSLQWNTVATAVKYRLYVFKSDGTTLYDQTYPVAVTATSYNFNQGVAGDKLYWRVTALDAAGNESLASDSRDLILQ